MDVLDACSALSNSTRLNLVSIIIDEGALTGKQAYEIYVEEHEEMRRQSIHSALNQLADAGILNKEYREENGGIVYVLPDERIEIDLESMEANFLD
jgi:Fe2+ or Zn2+ uptake regulation protein